VRLSFSILTLLLAGSPAAAQQQDSFEWRVNDQRAAPDPAQASKDGFGVAMFVTPDYEGFLKAWAGPTPPNVSTTEQVSRGKPVHAMLLFSGCRAGQDGNCDVIVELGVTGPDGSQYGDIFKGTVWNGPPPPAYNLQLGRDGLGFILEPEDSLGTYTLKAAITDKVAGTTLEVRKAIAAVELAAQ
jgi:hypothetical protein